MPSCEAVSVLRVHRSGLSAMPAHDPVDLVREVYPSLLATARRLVPASDVHDLVQDAMVETLTRHPAFAGIEHPTGYLRTVMLRAAFRRRRVRWIEVPLDLQERLEAPAARTDDRLTAESAMRELGVRQRACVVLRYLHGFDDEAIAEALDCRPSTVRSQIARAITRLRADMEDDDAHA